MNITTTSNPTPRNRGENESITEISSPVNLPDMLNNKNNKKKKTQKQRGERELKIKSPLL